MDSTASDPQTETPAEAPQPAPLDAAAPAPEPEPAPELPAAMPAALSVNAGVGATLRAAREGMGKDLSECSKLLRIRQAYLEAFEDGRHHDLPGGTYATGFLRSYAEFLGLDSEEMIRRFREEGAGGFKNRTELTFPSPVSEGRIPGGAIIFVGLILAAVVYGGWYLVSSVETRVTEMVPPLPERLAGLLHRQASLTGESKPAGEEIKPAEDTGKAKEDVVPPQEGDEDKSAVSPAPNSPAPNSPALTAQVAGVQDAAPAPSAPASDGAKVEPVKTEAAPAEPVKTEPAKAEPAKTEPVKAEPTKAETAKSKAEAAKAEATKAEAAKAEAAKAEAAKAEAAKAEAAKAEAAKAEAAKAEAAKTETAKSKAEAAKAEAAKAEAAKAEAAKAEAAKTETPAATSEGKVYGGEYADSRVVLRATGDDCWIQVREMDGSLLMSRLLRRGDSFRVPNRSGLNLMVGNAGALEVRVDGRKVPPLGSQGQVRRDIRLDPDKLSAGG